MEKSFARRGKKKNLFKFVPQCPQVLLAKNFDQYTISAFLHENLQIAYFEVQEIIGKTFGRAKKNQLKFVQKCPQVLLAKNFDRNTITMVLHKNLQIAYLEVQDTIGKIFCKKKNIITRLKIVLATNFDRNTISAFLHENLQIAYLEVLENNYKILL